MNKTLKKTLGIVLSLGMIAASVVLPTAASAEAATFDASATSWKFDFGASDQAAQDGYIAVAPDKNYMTAQDYGFLGIDGNGDKLGPRLDGFDQQEGQNITLTAGGGTGVNDGIGSTGADDYENPGDKYYPVRFAVKVPDETYYRITAKVTTLDTSKPATASLYTERKHPLYTEKTIAAGAVEETTFTIRVTPIYYQKSNPTGSQADGMINVCVLGENTALASLEITKLDTATTLWVLGDSTVTDGGGTLPFWPLQNYTGVGTGLTKYLPSTIAMVNEGEGGLNATDGLHFDMAKKRIKAGDFMYVEYGHNHKNSDGQHFTGEYFTNQYLQSLKKYYEACRDAQGGAATLVVVSPIDREQASQYDSETNTWSSTLGGFGEIGKKYVDCLMKGGETTAQNFLDKWEAISAEAEAHKVEEGKSGAKTTVTTELTTLKEEAEAIVTGATGTGVSNVAYVDLNTASLAWYKSLSGRTVGGLTGKALVDFYFQTPKGGTTDYTHPNDAGAENLAYQFFNAANATEYPALAPLLTAYSTAQAPTPVSDAIINLGAAGSSTAWPAYQPPVAFEYPIVIKDVAVEDGKFTTLTANVQAQFSNYASGVVEIYKDGVKQRELVTSDHIDNTTGKGTNTLHFSASDASNSLAEDETYKAYMWSCDTAVERLIPESEGGEYLSSIYEPTDIDTYILPGESTDIENFTYYGQTNLTGSTKYKWGGSSTLGDTLGTSGEVSYVDLTSNGGNSWVVVRALENLKDGETEVGTLTAGKYMINVDAQYVSGGGLSFEFTKGISTKSGALSSPFVTDVFKAFSIDAGGDVSISGGSETAGAVAGTGWTNIKYILDMNTGKASVSVGGGTPQEVNVAAYQTFGEPTTAIDTFKYFAFEGAKQSAFDVKLSNMTVAKLKEDTKTTLTAAVNEDARGKMLIDGAEIASKTVVAGENITVKAVANSGSVFTGWTDEDDNVISTEAEATLRMYRNATIKANFAKELGVSDIANYTIMADTTISKVGGKINLSIENVKSADNTPIYAAQNTDVTWTCDEPGVTISAAGVVSLDATSIAKNAKKDITIKGTLNGVEKTITVTAYTYAYYEPVKDGKTQGTWNGDKNTVASKPAIAFPGGGGTYTLTFPQPVPVKDRIVKVSYIAAGYGSTCGQSRELEFYDSTDTRVNSKLIGYSWTGLFLGGAYNGSKDANTIQNEDHKFDNAFSVGAWSTPVEITFNGDGTGSVAFGGTSYEIAYNADSEDIASIKFKAAAGAPDYLARGLYITDLTIEDLTEAPEDNITASAVTVNEDNVELTVTSTSDVSKKAQLIVASYEDGALKDIAISDAATIAAKGNVKLTAAKPTTSDFKIMLWTSGSKMYPINTPITTLSE